MNRLRVLHLGKFYPPVRGGMETILETLCRGEQHAVCTRALVTNRARRTEHNVVDGVSVTRLGRALMVGSVAITPTLPIALARAKTDLIVLHEPNPWALLAYCLVRPKARLIIWYHSPVVRPRWRYRLFYHPLLEFALRRAVRVVVASPPMRDAPVLAPHRAKCVVIPYGLDLDRYRPTNAVTARALALRAQFRAPVLLFIGRLVCYKGVDVLLRALPGLEAHVVIVGDGGLRGTLETTVRDLRIGNRVHFVGEVGDEERLAWLYACDALVLPSVTRQEAFGIVQLEAMLCGRPVVSTDVPTGVPWVNVHDQTGLVAACDAASLHGALRRLVADAGLRRRLGEAGRARVLETFSSEGMCTAVQALYQEVAATVASPYPEGRADQVEARAETGLM
jgi:rhamnosyl/mannosyltransferase